MLVRTHRHGTTARVLSAHQVLVQRHLPGHLPGQCALCREGGKGGAAGSQQALARMMMQQGMRMRADDGPGLHEVLRPELLMPVVRAPGALEALAPNLPQEHE